MFSRFIEQRSFVTAQDSLLAFFDNCLEKVSVWTMCIFNFSWHCCWFVQCSCLCLFSLRTCRKLLVMSRSFCDFVMSRYCVGKDQVQVCVKEWDCLFVVWVDLSEKSFGANECLYMERKIKKDKSVVLFSNSLVRVCCEFSLSSIKLLGLSVDLCSYFSTHW